MILADNLKQITNIYFDEKSKSLVLIDEDKKQIVLKQEIKEIK
jgi:membrane-bound inhibitor of C-type lysozyme